MVRKGIWLKVGTLFIVFSLVMSFASTNFVAAQGAGPQMLDPQLGVRPDVGGLKHQPRWRFLVPTNSLS
jgi:hypothetical protein